MQQNSDQQQSVESIEGQEMLAFYDSEARETSPLNFISETDMAVFEQNWLGTNAYIRLYCPTLYAKF